MLDLDKSDLMVLEGFIFEYHLYSYHLEVIVVRRVIATY